MKKVITYGTFDLFHDGHYNLLKRAKELGDYLIVGVTTAHFDEERGKMNVVDSVLERIENVRKTGFADEIIIEDHEGQKIEDIQKYGVDIFAVGSDWMGVFAYLESLCEVVYLERTPDISSTMLRKNRFPILRIGVVGTGRIAPRFIAEAKYVSGVNVKCAYNPHMESAERFERVSEISCMCGAYEDFLKEVDAVYIASPHQTHYDYARRAMEAGKHVLCEKPLSFTKSEAEAVYELAREKKVILMEAIKTAYCPGFVQMMNIAKSGKIGEIRDVEACFSRITSLAAREMIDEEYGGAFLEFGSYTLLPIIKLLGTDYEDVTFESIPAENGVDLYSKVHFKYKDGLALSKTGIGVKSEGQLVIAGTKGYILAQSPWWLTRKFEIRYEDSNQIERYSPKFMGDGLRYEISEFASRINGTLQTTFKLTRAESIAMADIVERFMKKRQEEKAAVRKVNKESGMRIWAHRGCSYEYPENTLAAFQAAGEIQGITGIELDIQLTKDGEIVVFHDETLDRLMNAAGNLCDYTLTELRKMKFKDYDYEKQQEKKISLEAVRIPAMEEVLQLLEKKCKEKHLLINIELKNSRTPYPGMEEKILALVSKYQMENYIVYSSFSGDSITKIRQLMKKQGVHSGTGILSSDIIKCAEYGTCGENQENLAYHPSADSVLKLGIQQAQSIMGTNRIVRAWNSSEPFYNQKKKKKIYNMMMLKDRGVTDFITNLPEEYLPEE